MRDVDLAYLAGVIDADGYVTATSSVRKTAFYAGAQVGITGSRREPHDLAASLFGGTVSAHRPGTRSPNHLTQFHWQRSGESAVPVIEAVLPYLRIKAVRARMVLDLQDQVRELRMAREAGNPAPWMPPGYDPSRSLRAWVEEIRERSASEAASQDPLPFGQVHGTESRCRKVAERQSEWHPILESRDPIPWQREDL